MSMAAILSTLFAELRRLGQSRDKTSRLKVTAESKTVGRRALATEIVRSNPDSSSSSALSHSWPDCRWFGPVANRPEAVILS